jgi:hypothetical protein
MTGFGPRQRQRIFPLAAVSRPALRTTQPPIQWVLSPGVKRNRGVTLTTHPHLQPRSRMSKSYTTSPPWRRHGAAEQLLASLHECATGPCSEPAESSFHFHSSYYYRSSYTLTDVVAKWLTLLLRIYEGQRSNLGPDTG